VTAGCGISTASTTSAALGAPVGTPITVGISLPLTGDFAADGEASLRGYRLWADDVNAHGGLLRRPVKLIIRNDRSDPNAVKADYQALIRTDRVDLVLAPFSSLLTEAAAEVTSKLGYALVAGSATAPKVYAMKLRSLFSTSVPASGQMLPLVHYVLTLASGARPTSAAYAVVDDPFADPPVATAHNALEAAGIHTAYSNIDHPFDASATAAQLEADAKHVADSGAQMVLLGTVDVPTVSAFIHEFAKLNYNPKILIAAAGPDQGQSFLDKVGNTNALGVMVPNGWYGNFENALSHIMVQDYIARYGGTASDINADVAESYSAGETLAAAVTGSRGLKQPLLITWLHNNTVQTVLGPAQFTSAGVNKASLQSALVLQWQPGPRLLQVLPLHAPGSVPLINPKPNFGG
jgi:branched-chain amino acid transport system substrate-binding protein